MMKKLAIFGSEGTAVELREYVDQFAEFDEVQIIFIDNETSKHPFLYHRESDEIRYIFGVADHKWRQVCLAQLESLLHIKPYSFVHPSAFVARSANIGFGVYIGPNSTIAPFATLEDHSHININASVGHHSIIGEHSIILPGARISGNVTIGKCGLIGSNSVVFQGLTIGDNCSVDAMCYVKKNTPSNTITFGTKSKTIKKIGS